jgi:2'-hydroxyisoflavone reductase
MRILVLGGTQFVGRHLVEELARAGHSITLFNRGQTPDNLPPALERLRGDRDQGPAGLTALEGRTWDVCLDVSGYTAPHVRSSTQRLRTAVGHYVFISAVSVYGAPAFGPVDEESPRVPPVDESVTDITAETYGRLKVTCEDLVLEQFGDRSTLLRPQIVAGPHDPFDRFSYWVRRAAEGGETLAPGDGSDFLQVVDALDVARFTRRVCEERLSGTYNLAGLRVTWREFLDRLEAKNIVWAPAAVLAAERITEFELPLFRAAGSPRSGLMHVSSQRAGAAGFPHSTIAETIARVRAWLPSSNLPPALSREREARLIAAARGHAPS